MQVFHGRFEGQSESAAGLAPSTARTSASVRNPLRCPRGRPKVRVVTHNEWPRRRPGESVFGCL